MIVATSTSRSVSSLFVQGCYLASRPVVDLGGDAAAPRWPTDIAGTATTVGVIVAGLHLQDAADLDALEPAAATFALLLISLRTGEPAPDLAVLLADHLVLRMDVLLQLWSSGGPLSRPFVVDRAGKMPPEQVNTAAIAAAVYVSSSNRLPKMFSLMRGRLATAGWPGFYLVGSACLDAFICGRKSRPGVRCRDYRSRTTRLVNSRGRAAPAVSVGFVPCRWGYAISRHSPQINYVDCEY